jgi:RNase adapter protein RapZ
MGHRMTGPKRILLITGMSGAGRTTALKTLEDLGWETADNLPLVLVDRLLERPLPDGASDDTRPFAVGIDSRTRGFDAAAIVRRVHTLQESGRPIEIVFFDCNGAELVKRFSATRRRHPLALDRQAEDGIARERELLTPLREAAATLIDTSDLTSNGLQQEIRARFGDQGVEGPTLVVTSFGFSRGLPRNADLVFDLRFLRNPHWVPTLRPGTGLDPDVAGYVAADPTYPEAMDRFEGLLTLLLPRYVDEGKSYITVAFGCTGGRHRSVHVAEEIGRRLRLAGFSPTIIHRDLTRPTTDAVERGPEASDIQT